MALIDNTRQGDMQETFSVTVMVESANLLINAKDIISCYFIEDIYKFCMVGKIVFNDMYGFLEEGPFTGNEKIIISYGEVESRQLIFDIWKVNKISQLSVTDPTSISMVEVTFIDTIYELFTLRKYSKSWPSNTEISTIMGHILKVMCGLKSINTVIETTESPITGFAMPYWTPIQALKWLMMRAKSLTTKTSGYLCYNNTYKTFTSNIRTLDYLFSIRTPIDEKTYYFEHEDILYRNKILEWTLNGIDNSTTKMLRGGHWRGYNFKEKRFIDVSYKYSDGIDESTLLGRKSLFENISDISTSYNTLSETNESDIKRIIYSDWTKRYSVQQTMNFIVRGFEDRYAGQQIDVMWPAAERVNVKYNKQLTGRYLIKSVTHMFTGGDSTIPYRQKLVCLKNAYHDSDFKALYKATKTNTALPTEFGS